MPIYGFKADDPDSQVAIGSLLSRADSVETLNFDTLAQYVISNIELKPTSLSYDKPKQWGLVVNTTFDGLNDDSNQAIYFDNKYKDIGDGYLTYTLSAEEFSDMILGGLYDNPKAYIAKLKDELIGKKFYRATNVNLLKVIVLDDSLNISVGDLSAKDRTGEIYYVGQDLQSYDTLTKESQSDFSSQLNTLFAKFKETPVLDTGKGFDVPEPVVPEVDGAETSPLSDVDVKSEVDYGIDYDKLDNKFDAAVDSVAPLSDFDVPVVDSNFDTDLPVVEDSNQPDMSMDQLMDELLSQTAKNTTRKKKNTHQYVDEFANALAESQTSTSKIKKKRQTSQAVVTQQKQKDAGLEL